jgi:GNAT superfamily N-acetyltransferase
MADHYRRVELAITIDEFHRLPRNPAYKYEYFGGRAVLTPRPKLFACARDLSPVESDPFEPVEVRPLPAADARGLAGLFARSLWPTQPYASLDDDAARAALDATLNRTLAGEDGPLIEAACFRAVGDRREGDVGGVLVTLAPPEVLTVPFAGVWKAPPPADAVEGRLGVPHLTWVFVDPWVSRRGVGSALLAAAVDALRGLGFDALASTFALDNGPSALWHWRHGFRLLPQMSALWAEAKRGRAAGQAP